VPTSPLYPGAVRNFGSDVVNFTDTILAEHVNYLRAEVNSIETVLGTYLTLSSGFVGSYTEPTISFTWDSLKDRLANIEYGLHTAYAAKVPTGGTTGQVLVKSSGSDYAMSWTTGNFLPSQSSNNGKYLTTNGTSASWASISQVPSQSGQTGKYLTTDGSTASWATVPASYSAPTLGSTSIASGATVTNVNGLTINSTTIPSSKTLVSTDSVYAVPSQSGNTGKYLTTDGSTASWSTVSGETFSPFLLIGA